MRVRSGNDQYELCPDAFADTCGHGAGQPQYGAGRPMLHAGLHPIYILTPMDAETAAHLAEVAVVQQLRNAAVK